MVAVGNKTVEPQCNAFSLSQKQLQDSFKDLVSDLSDCGYAYYNVRQRPTTSFYYIDVIGDLSAEEPVFVDNISLALMNAWKKEYSTYTTVEFPVLSNEFYKRIGSLGTLISRVYYTINVDNERVLINYKAAPSYDKIEAEFNRIGYDFRIYPTCNSSPKSLFASFYLKVYPLRADDRGSYENQIRTGLMQSNTIQAALNNRIVAVYSELYRSQTFGYNVSRIYYSVC